MTLTTATGTDETEAMNRLQAQGGIISDNCVNAEDVAADDAGNAVAWLAFSNRNTGTTATRARDADFNLNP